MPGCTPSSWTPSAAPPDYLARLLPPCLVMGYLPIADYALVGDCHSAALVARSGSVDWYCPARFDAPAVFCRLLDHERGGFLSLAPLGEFEATRRYRGHTNVLETTYRAAGGRVRFTDLMPLDGRTPTYSGHDVGTHHRLLRLVEGLAGEVELELRFKPTFDFARGETELEPRPGGALARKVGDFLALACPEVALEPHPEGGLRGRLSVKSGDRRWVALTYTRGQPPPDSAWQVTTCADELARTLHYWQGWVGRCGYQGRYRDQVLRSELALKLLIYEPTGAIVAAPTTSLPERIGGERNWDYRYTWLRDSALTLYALLSIGHHEEATDFFEWLQRVEQADPKPELQIMYGVDGALELPESTLDHLEGYRGSRPVRVGNAAATQLQLDVYGEVLRAAHLYHVGVPGHRLDDRPPRPRTWVLWRGLVEQAANRWEEPDHGIWEMRGEPRQFLYSRLMCWAALDAGIGMAEELGLQAPLDRWREQRETIRRAI